MFDLLGVGVYSGFRSVVESHFVKTACVVYLSHRQICAHPAV